MNNITLDYANSDDPAEIDSGIRDTIRGIRPSILEMGLGLAKIRSNRLFANLGHKSITSYIKCLSNDSKIDHSNVFNWLYMGEAYIKYRYELEKIGFSDSDGPTKLPYLERALAVRKKQDVFENIKTMSVREFINFAKGDFIARQSDMPYVIFSGNVVYIQGKRAIILNKNLNRRTTAFFIKVIEVACEALDKGGVIMPVFLRNMRDARRFGHAAEQIKTRWHMK